MASSVGNCASSRLSAHCVTRMQAHHGRGPKPCPLCEEQLSGVTFTDHVLSSHNQEFQLPSLTPESLLTVLVDREVTFVYRFRNLIVILFLRLCSVYIGPVYIDFEL